MQYRRRLPHIEVIDTPVFVTWRLRDSVARARQASVLISRPKPRTEGAQRLGDTAVARMVAETLLCSQKHFYTLHAWVIMPNHVHLLLTPHVPLRRVTQWLKGATARKANAILQRAGERFWLDESFDRVVRSGEELAGFGRYIEHNPDNAGLATAPELYPWSHAGWAG